MFRSPSRLLPLAFAVTMATAACNNNNPFNIVTPTPTDPVTETFTGTLGVNGGVTHTFVAAFPGEVTATLSAIEPTNEDDATIIGFSLGAWNGASCTVVTANDTATRNTVLFGRAISAGQLCVRAYDVGRLAAPVSYTITVVRP